MQTHLISSSTSYYFLQCSWIKVRKVASHFRTVHPNTIKRSRFSVDVAGYNYLSTLQYVLTWLKLPIENTWYIYTKVTETDFRKRRQNTSKIMLTQLVYICIHIHIYSIIAVLYYILFMCYVFVTSAVCFLWHCSLVVCILLPTPV